MGVELIAQHRELGGTRLVFEPLELIRLFLDRQEEIDRIIERRPCTKQSEGEVEGPEEQLQPGGLNRRVECREHPGIEEGGARSRQYSDEDRHGPGAQRLLEKEL